MVSVLGLVSGSQLWRPPRYSIMGDESNTIAVTESTRRELRREATSLLRQQGFSADGRPSIEAHTSRQADILGNRNLKWEPPKRT